MRLSLLLLTLPACGLFGEPAGPANRAPTAADDAFTLAEDTPEPLGVLANDSDPDDDPLQVTEVGAASQGTATSTGVGVRYAPAANWSGTDQFTYTVADPDGATATATVTVTVEPVNDPPRASGDVTVVPAEPGVDDDLSREGTWTVTDVEGDPTTLAYQWEQSTAGATTGFTALAGATADTLSADRTVAEAWYRLTATPSDGTDQGTTVRTPAVQVRGNHPPAITDAPTVAPAVPITTDDLALTGSFAASDPEGDEITIALQWQASTTGPTSGFAAVPDATGDTLSADATVRDGWYRVQATPSDAFGVGEPDHTAAVQVENSPPVVDTVPAPTPSSPSTDQDLAVDLGAVQTSDLDGDAVSLAVQWQASTDDGSTWADLADATAATLPSTATTVGTWYRACVTPDDGTDAGTTECSTEVVVGANQPPAVTGTTPAVEQACPGVDADIEGIRVDEDASVVIAVATNDPEGTSLAVYQVVPLACETTTPGDTPPNAHVTGIDDTGAIQVKYTLDGEGDPTGQPATDCPCTLDDTTGPDECTHELVPLDASDGTTDSEVRFTPWNGPGWQEFGPSETLWLTADDGDLFAEPVAFPVYIDNDLADAPVAVADDLGDLGFLEWPADPYPIPTADLLANDYDPDVAGAGPRAWDDPCQTAPQTIAVDAVGTVTDGGLDTAVLGTDDLGDPAVLATPAAGFDSVEAGHDAAFEYQLADSTNALSGWAEATFQVDPRDPAAHWTLDDTSSGLVDGVESVTLTLTGGAVTPGQVGDAIDFQGTATAATSATWPVDSGFVASLWVKTNFTTALTTDQAILALQPSGTAPDLALWLDGSSTRLDVDDGATSASVTGTDAVNSGAWTHVALGVQVDATETTVDLWVDGTHQDTQTVTGAWASPDPLVRLAHTIDAGSDAFHADAALDEVVFYDAPPSQALVDHLYDLGVAGTSPL